MSLLQKIFFILLPSSSSSRGTNLMQPCWLHRIATTKGTEMNFHLLTRKQLPFFLKSLKTNKQNNSSCTKTYNTLRTYHFILKKKIPNA